MQIIYPGDYFNANRVDETFEAECDSARKAGLKSVLLSSQSFHEGKIKFSGSFEPGQPVIWRGWMLKEKEYRALHDAVSNCGAEMWVSPEYYAACHYITGWYELCRDYTPETIFLKESDDFSKVTSALQWPAWFVKDYVKSLTTSRGSVARNAEEIQEILAGIKQFRGEIEGGVALRKFEQLKPDSERRYFSFNHKVFAADDVIPDVVQKIANDIKSPFFSIDMAESTAGDLRLIEIGDGQVSDIKEWDVQRFINMLRTAG